MGYQPRAKPRRGASHEYTKPLRERRKDRKRLHMPTVTEKKQIATEKEISEATLKRLHILGSQKFGSSPFSDHFNRWITNIETILNEFESHPSIEVDEQFLKERSDSLAIIKLQLEDRRQIEARLEQELKSLAYCRASLKQISNEYATATNATKIQKNSQIKQLNSIINQLKKEQDEVIRLKTGFFRGVSQKSREQKESAIVQELIDKQKELEVITMNFNAELKILNEEYERKKEPVLEQIKFFKKKIGNLDIDGSLEERWFACESLIDAVNSFLQRKAAYSSDGKPKNHL
jgi:hypothetical protein